MRTVTLCGVKCICLDPDVLWNAVQFPSYEVAAAAAAAAGGGAAGATAVVAVAVHRQ